MSGITTLAADIENVVINKGIPMLMESYAAQQVVWSSLGEVIGVEDASSPYKGDIAGELLGLARPHRIKHGQDIPGTALEQGYTAQGAIHKFAHHFTLTVEDIQAAQGNAMNAAMRGVNEYFPKFAEVFAQEKDDYIAGMFNNGTLTAGSAEYFCNSYDGRAAADGLIYDGMPWFDTAHPESPTTTGTTYSNHAAGDLTDANLKAALTVLRSTNAKNGRGDRIQNNPDTLLVPAELEFTARTLVESTTNPDNANNQANTIPRLRVVPWAALTDTDGWFLGASGMRSGLRIINAGPPRVTVVANEHNDTVMVKAVSYFGAYVRDWRPWLARNTSAT